MSLVWEDEDYLKQVAKGKGKEGEEEGEEKPAEPAVDASTDGNEANKVGS